MSGADPLRIADYMRHIVEAIDNIFGLHRRRRSFKVVADRKTQYAVIRNLEVIGGACNDVTKKSSRLCRATGKRALGFCL